MKIFASLLFVLILTSCGADKPKEPEVPAGDGFSEQIKKAAEEKAAADAKKAEAQAKTITELKKKLEGMEKSQTDLKALLDKAPKDEDMQKQFAAQAKELKNFKEYYNFIMADDYIDICARLETTKDDCEDDNIMPEVNFQKIIEISLADNDLSEIPSWVFAISGLKILDIAGNDKIRTLPEELGTLAALTTIYVGDDSKIKADALPAAIKDKVKFSYPE